jgi:hypothetical protein
LVVSFGQLTVLCGTSLFKLALFVAQTQHVDCSPGCGIEVCSVLSTLRCLWSCKLHPVLGRHLGGLAMMTVATWLVRRAVPWQLMV